MKSPRDFEWSIDRLRAVINRDLSPAELSPMFARMWQKYVSAETSVNGRKRNPLETTYWFYSLGSASGRCHDSGAHGT